MGITGGPTGPSSSHLPTDGCPTLPAICAGGWAFRKVTPLQPHRSSAGSAVVVSTFDDSGPCRERGWPKIPSQDQPIGWPIQARFSASRREMTGSHWPILIATSHGHSPRPCHPEERAQRSEGPYDRMLLRCSRQDRVPHFRARFLREKACPELVEGWGVPNSAFEGWRFSLEWGSREDQLRPILIASPHGRLPHPSRDLCGRVGRSGK